MQRNHSATLNDLSQSVELPSSLLAGLQRAATTGGPARHFWQMCDRFSEQKALYVLCRRLSDAVHPSLCALNHHLQSDAERGIFGLEIRSASEPDHDLLVGLAFSAVFAVTAVEWLRRGQPRLSAAAAIADKWQVPLTLQHSDRHPELRRP